ncbi:MAG: TRAP transporter TatT component family protein [Wenzhouxiangellaceae bacterium]|nr:TRAP transporter TatT component family protein [Wenzhouxiangellaceae bacterium]
MTGPRSLSKTVFVAAPLVLSGCGAMIDRATTNFARDLEQAVVNYEEPLVVERGLPAFLLVLEARRQANPDDPGLLLSLSELTGTYASLFVDDAEANRRLAARALDYARRAACLRDSVLCGAGDRPFAEFERAVSGLTGAEIETDYALGTAWVAWIAANSSDYAALADLPRVELLLEKVAALAPEHDDGAVWLYLAVLNSQRPPAAGGRPELAREYYERARAVSGGRNLLVNVFMADEYARLMFDRELYVRLLEEVLAADPDQPGYVLANRIAQARAEQMLSRTSEIFD